MPTILTHCAVPIAIRLGLGQEAISNRLLAAGIAVSVIPDLDVLAFRLGIPYASELGHRGFSHSFLFAIVLAAVGAAFARLLFSTLKCSFFFLLVAAASHGILDTFTNGGLGVALLWPLSSDRFFAPIHPIEVSPLGLSRFLSGRGFQVLQSEFLWVWLPCLTIALTVMIFRRYRSLRR